MSIDNQVQALLARVEALERRAGVLEDTNQIRHLQHTYSYYLDKGLYNEIVDLFSDTGSVSFLGGRFRGKTGARRLYCGRLRARNTGGKNGPVYGYIIDHPTMQDVITVAPDGRTAKARFRCLMQAGRHESAVTPERPLRQWFEGGAYENTYVKEDGVWKFEHLNYYPEWHGDLPEGWAHTRPQYVPFYEAKNLYPGDPSGPDELTEEKPWLWPDVRLVPFHYPHPVTGRPVEAEP
jgi:hypothetical protein